MFCILNYLVLLGICQGLLVHKGEHSPDLNRRCTATLLWKHWVEAHHILMHTKERPQSQALLSRENEQHGVCWWIWINNFRRKSSSRKHFKYLKIPATKPPLTTWTTCSNYSSYCLPMTVSYGQVFSLSTWTAYGNSQRALLFCKKRSQNYWEACEQVLVILEGRQTFM